MRRPVAMKNAFCADAAKRWIGCEACRARWVRGLVRNGAGFVRFPRLILVLASGPLPRKGEGLHMFVRGHHA